HTTWFFEMFVLEKAGPTERLLFNSYYENIGERIPRAHRGLLTRPSLEEVLSYRERVDKEILRTLESIGTEESGEVSGLVELGLHHEQQHQELILTDVKSLLFANPLRPAYVTSPADQEYRATPDARMLRFP